MEGRVNRNPHIIKIIYNSLNAVKVRLGGQLLGACIDNEMNCLTAAETSARSCTNEILTEGNTTFALNNADEELQITINKLVGNREAL